MLRMLPLLLILAWAGLGHANPCVVTGPSVPDGPCLDSGPSRLRGPASATGVPGSTTTSTTATTLTTTTVAPTTTTVVATTTTTAAATTTTTLSTPLNCASSFVALYRLEEAALSNRVADSGSTCGAAGNDCNLNEAGDQIERSATHIEGSYSVDFTVAQAENLRCLEAVCNEFNWTGDLTVLGWMYPTSQTSTHYALYQTNFSTNGFHLARADATNHLTCGGCNGSSCTTETSSTGQFSEDQWTHVACKIDDTANEIVPYINGSANGCTPGSTCQSLTQYSETGNQFNMSLQSGAGWNGLMDEVAITDKALSAAWICRFAACGVDGTTGPCTCSGATYTDDGRLTSMSLGCSLSGVACNAACP